jgi:hypothetical protein
MFCSDMGIDGKSEKQILTRTHGYKIMYQKEKIPVLFLHEKTLWNEVAKLEWQWEHFSLLSMQLEMQKQYHKTS